MKQTALGALKWLFGSRWGTTLLLAAIVAVEFHFFPPQLSLLWWGVLKAVSAAGGLAWSAFRLLPDMVQVYAGVALVSILAAWWVIKRLFVRIVLGSIAVILLPWFDFGTKMYVLYYALPTLVFFGGMRWIIRLDWDEHHRSVHPVYLASHPRRLVRTEPRLTPVGPLPKASQIGEIKK